MLSCLACTGSLLGRPGTSSGLGQWQLQTREGGKPPGGVMADGAAQG